MMPRWIRVDRPMHGRRKRITGEIRKMSEASKGAGRKRSARDTPTLDTLLSKYGRRLHRFIRTRSSAKLRRTTSVDDLFQDTVAAAIESGNTFSFRGEAEFVNWIFTIARRKMYQAAIKVDRSPVKIRIKRMYSSGDGVPEEKILGKVSTASSIAARGERNARLRQRINELPERFSRVLIAYRLEERDLDEVAVMLGYSRAYTGKLVTLAYAALAAQLEGSSCRPMA